MTKLILDGQFVEELLFLYPTLTKVMQDILKIWPVEDLIVTSIWRSEEENKAAGAKTRIHVVGPPYRAIDLRVTNLGEGFQVQAEEIADTINAIWQYDPGRPSLNVVHAKVHGTGPHCHCQVHPNTVRVST